MALSVLYHQNKTSYFLNLSANSSIAFLFLPIKSPINAPEIKQIIRLVMAKKSSPIAFTICGVSPVAFKENTIAAQMQKPTMDAPTNMNVALLVVIYGGFKPEVECKGYHRKNSSQSYCVSFSRNFR